MRLAIPLTQKPRIPNSDEDLLSIEASIYAEKPQKDIHSFIGKFTCTAPNHAEESLSIENTMCPKKSLNPRSRLMKGPTGDFGMSCFQV